MSLQAYAELQAYTATEAGQTAPLEEKEPVRRLLNLMQSQADIDRKATVLTIDSALTDKAPDVESDRMIPLTW